MRRDLVSAVALLLFAACGPSRAALRPGDAAEMGEQFDLTARDLDGYRRTVGELTGGRVALIDIWATWCVSCGDALLAWERLADRYHERLAVVAISIDEDRRQLPKFLARTPVSFPILWDRGGREALSRLALERVPTVLILDAEGRVRHVHEGWNGRYTAEAIAAEVAALLEAPADPEERSHTNGRLSRAEPEGRSQR